MALEVEEGDIAKVEEGEIRVEEGEIADEYDDVRRQIDVDKAFSYMDKRIESVLGDLRENFEGLLSKENLGPMYGGYGSFLPTYVQPTSTLLHEVEAIQSMKRQRGPPILFQEAEAKQSATNVRPPSIPFREKETLKKQRRQASILVKEAEAIKKQRGPASSLLQEALKKERGRPSILLQQAEAIILLQKAEPKMRKRRPLIPIQEVEANANRSGKKQRMFRKTEANQSMKKCADASIKTSMIIVT